MPEETTKDSQEKLDISNNIKTRSSDWMVKNDDTITEKDNNLTNVVKDTKASLTNNNYPTKVKFVDKSSEQLLGSTFLPNGTTENGHALRASARVIHKLRMDSAMPNSPSINIMEGKKEEESLTTGKRKEEHKVNPKTPSQPKNSFRMTWNNEEKDMFFDALNEYGRDFEAIATYINNKQKRKNPTDLFYKTKDQVRVLYYQFYQKVSKYLKFSDEVKKIPQELYALINYGEMRKKLIFINEKSFLKLRELVYKGSVTIRTKGKNIKIKTPSCRALRKLNQLEEWQEEIKLPHRIDVILRPANVDAWGKVQSLAHNPRIRTQVPLQRRMSSLIQTLQHRWRSQELRLQEKFMTLERIAASAPSKSKVLKTHAFESEYKKQIIEPLLCFAPPPELPIHRPVVHLSEFLSSDSICLNSYEQRIGVSIKGESLCSNNTKRVRHDSGNGEKASGHVINNKSPEQKRQKLEIDIKPLIDTSGNDTNEEPEDKVTVANPGNNDLLLSPNSSSRDSNEQNPVLPIVESNLDLMDFRSNDSTDYPTKVYSWTDLPDQAGLSENELKTDDSNDVNVLKKEIKIDALPDTPCDSATNEKKFEIAKVKKGKNRKKDVRKEATHFRPLISQKVLQEIRNGWTLKNAGDLTFGDLYVMFGQSSKLYLEYSWVQIKDETETNSSETASDIKLDVKVETHQKIASNENISMKLKQLLLVAQLQDKTKRRGTCACGHICDHRKINKTLNDGGLSTPNNEGLFKHPNVPNRRLQTFTNVSEGMRTRLAKLYRPRTRPMFTGKQVIVQRMLPVQPGVNHSYGVVTNNESSLTSSTTKQNEIPSTPEANQPPNAACTVTIQTIDGEISQLLSAKINQLSETKTPAELCNTDSFKSLMELSLPDMPSTGAKRDFSDDDQEYIYPSTPLMSPMRILHESPIEDGYDVEDVSLSSILGHLENACNVEQEIDQSDNVSVITEASIDYIARFEDMTAELQNK